MAEILTAAVCLGTVCQVAALALLCAIFRRMGRPPKVVARTIDGDQITRLG